MHNTYKDSSAWWYIMTGAMSCKNEDHVGFKLTPGSVLIILGVLWIRMASLSLLLCKLLQISDLSHLILCPVLLTWMEIASWGSPTLIGLLCSDILIFKVRPVSLIYVPPTHNVWHKLLPFFSLHGVGSVSLESDDFIVCLDVKATLTGSFLTDLAIFSLIPDTYGNTRVFVFSTSSGWFL